MDKVTPMCWYAVQMARNAPYLAIWDLDTYAGIRIVGTSPPGLSVRNGNSVCYITITNIGKDELIYNVLGQKNKELERAKILKGWKSF